MSWNLIQIVDFFYHITVKQEIFTLLFSYVVPVQRKVKILQNFVAFSEYMNFTLWLKHSSIIQNEEIGFIFLNKIW